jgi:hypothetical protein
MRASGVTGVLIYWSSTLSLGEGSQTTLILSPGFILRGSMERPNRAPRFMHSSWVKNVCSSLTIRFAVSAVQSRMFLDQQILK